jgi:hypothetical protein
MSTRPRLILHAVPPNIRSQNVLQAARNQSALDSKLIRTHMKQKMGASTEKIPHEWQLDVAEAKSSRDLALVMVSQQVHICASVICLRASSKLV